jgi:hypothetical protein
MSFMSLDVREKVWQPACTMKDSGRMVGGRGAFFSDFPRKLLFGLVLSG